MSWSAYLLYSMISMSHLTPSSSLQKYLYMDISAIFRWPVFIVVTIFVKDEYAVG